MQELKQLPNPEELGAALKLNSHKKQIDFQGIRLDNRIFGDPRYTKKTKFTVLSKLLTKKGSKKEEFSRHISIAEDKFILDITHKLKDFSLNKVFTFNLFEADADKDLIIQKGKTTEQDKDNSIRTIIDDKLDSQEIDHSLTKEEQLNESKEKIDILAGKDLEEQAEEAKAAHEKIKRVKKKRKVKRKSLDPEIKEFIKAFPKVNRKFFVALGSLKDEDYSEDELDVLRSEFETHEYTGACFKSLLAIGFDLDDLYNISINVVEK